MNKKWIKIISSSLIPIILATSITVGCGSFSDPDFAEYNKFNKLASKDYEVVPLSELQYDADGNLNYQPTEEGAGLYVLYGNETFGNVFKSDNITLNEILSIIDSNKNIEKEYKPFIKEYFTDLVAMYPDLELRTFAYNLYSVKVITLSADKVADSAGKESIAAYWLHDENKIIINEDTDLENNAKDRLILRHEIGHLGNYFRIKEDDILYKFDFNLAYFDYVNECLTVIFTSSPYMDEYAEAEITNMGYPRGTNQMRVLLDCIDYTPDKIISNNYVLLQRKLDDVMGDYFDAATILTIINDETLNATLGNNVLEEDDQITLYKYISQIYLRTHINENMSYKEIMDNKDALIERLISGLSEDGATTVRQDIITEEFENYCTQNGIK